MFFFFCKKNVLSGAKAGKDKEEEQNKKSNIEVKIAS